MLTHRSVTIEITYSNPETSKLGVATGDQFEASHEYLDGKPNGACWFTANGEDCVAYNCENDPKSTIKVTTCKIIKE